MRKMTAIAHSAAQARTRKQYETTKAAAYKSICIPQPSLLIHIYLRDIEIFVYEKALSIRASKENLSCL